MRRFGDADLAEESVQEAFGRAAARWPIDGTPGSPLGWIVATAGNVAVDRLRRERALRERLPALAAEPARSDPDPFEEQDTVPDDRLDSFVDVARETLKGMFPIYTPMIHASAMQSTPTFSCVKQLRITARASARSVMSPR